jgi:hypothetical protein
MDMKTLLSELSGEISMRLCMEENLEELKSVSCNSEPFLVPAMVDLFSFIGELTNQACAL